MPTPQVSSVRGPHLRIISINDVYSLENLPRLATLVQQRRTTNPADAFLVVLAGDFLAPSMLSSLDRGKGMVACLNAVGVTHVIFGNHEDDVPVGELHRRIQEFRGVWISTNMRDFDPLTVAHAVVPVTATEGGAPQRTVRVGLVGAVMTDATVYRRPPFGGSPLLPVNASVLDEVVSLRNDAHTHAHARCDLVIPITHQSLRDDRALIEAARVREIPLPLILGGHEHDVHVERDDETWLVKAGSEATRAAIIEMTWLAERTGDDVPTVTVELEPLEGYAEDLAVRGLVDSHMKKVHELEGAVLLPLAEGELLSSVGTRARQTSMGTLVCTQVRDALHAEVCLLNGGGIRASRDYTSHLAFGDIKAELPFDNEMVIVRMPGQVLRDAVAASRAVAPLESGGFLQVDDGVEIDATGRVVVAVGGEPLVPERDYEVAAVRAFFTGMDHIEPLSAFAQAHPERIPPPTAGRELKEVLVEALAFALWNRLGGFDVLDADHDGKVTEAEVAAAVTRVLGEPASPLTVTLVMNAVDTNHDHLVSREEACLVAKPARHGFGDRTR